MNPYKYHELLPHQPIVTAGFSLLKVIVAVAINLLTGQICYVRQVSHFGAKLSVLFLNQAHAHSRPSAGCGRAPGLLKLFS